MCCSIGDRNRLNMLYSDKYSSLFCHSVNDVQKSFVKFFAWPVPKTGNPGIWKKTRMIHISFEFKDSFTRPISLSDFEAPFQNQSLGLFSRQGEKSIQNQADNLLHARVVKGKGRSPKSWGEGWGFHSKVGSFAIFYSKGERHGEIA